MAKRKYQGFDQSQAGGAAEPKAKKQNRSKPRSPPGQSSLELLPTEILQNIILRLDHEDYIVVKHVSRTLDRATRQPIGCNLFDIALEQKRYRDRSRADDALLSSTASTLYPTRASKIRKLLASLPPSIPNFSKTLIRAEHRVLKGRNMNNIKLLTCSWCGHLKEHGLDGFDDVQFDKTKEARICVKCMLGTGDYHSYMWRKKFFVHGVAMGKCWNCYSGHPLPTEHVHSKGEKLERVLWGLTVSCRRASGNKQAGQR